MPRDIAEAARWFHLAAKPGLEGRLRSAADGQDEAPHAQRQGSAPPCYKAPRQCRIEAGHSASFLQTTAASADHKTQNHAPGTRRRYKKYGS